MTSLLPLTARQLGRAWWWVGVGAPSALISALLATGAVVQLLVHPEIAVHWDALILLIASIWLWLGSGFTVLFHLGQGPARDWRQRTQNAGLGAFWGLMAGGSFIFVRWIDSYDGAKALCWIIGLVLTVLGWARAEQMVAGRAGFRVAPPTADKSPASPPSAIDERQRGGLAYLVSRTCLRAFTIGLIVMTISPLMMVIMNGRDWHTALKSATDTGPTPFWIVLVFALLPVLTQLRFLRTLPISTGTLSLSLLVMFLTPCLALGVTSALVAGAVSGPDVGFLVGKRSLLSTAMLSLALPLALWRGFGRGSYVLLILIIIVLQTGPIIFGSVLFRHPALATGSALLAPVISLALSRLALERGSRAYRVAAMTFPNAWGGVR